MFGHPGGEQSSRSSAGTVRNGHEGVLSRGASAHPTHPSNHNDPPIHASESKSMNLADFQPQPVWVVALDGSADYFNLYWERFTGLCEEESLHFGWIRALHPDDVDAFLKQLRNSADRAFEFEVRLKRAGDGRYRRHLCRPSLLPHGSDRLAKLLICCMDVEDWKSSHDAAQEQAALLGFSLRAYDEEKRKTAHAIHDSAGQYLIALQMKLDGLQRASGNGARKSPFLDECSELVKRCSRELRAISYLLHPPLLDDLGLEAAVRFHVDSFVERTKIKVELDMEPNLGRLDRDSRNRAVSRRSGGLGEYRSAGCGSKRANQDRREFLERLCGGFSLGGDGFFARQAPGLAPQRLGPEHCHHARAHPANRRNIRTDLVAGPLDSRHGAPQSSRLARLRLAEPAYFRTATSTSPSRRITSMPTPCACRRMIKLTFAAPTLRFSIRTYSTTAGR